MSGSIFAAHPDEKVLEVGRGSRAGLPRDLTREAEPKSMLERVQRVMLANPSQSPGSL